MKAFKLLADYLYLSKKRETETDNNMIKAMHLINRISLLLFLLCLMMMLSKLITQTVLN
ncbi:DUF6728 family protein [Terrimonas sp.]|uniref:DUF6728 family protein n=1 Tax=Terrimonas sp. TaxID=1914338 RepID=UPI00268AE539